MIPEIDIWRAAQLMLKRYGDKALEESAARADELAGRPEMMKGWQPGAGSHMPSVNSPAKPRPDQFTDQPLLDVLSNLSPCRACDRTVGLE